MHTYTFQKLHDLFMKGELSAEKIVKTYLARIEAFDPKIEAFLHIMNERVLSKAKALDEKRARNEPLGKLAGVPIAIKDNINIKGQITTCGSKFLENFRAPFNATVIELLEKEDAILIGKTNLDEFAMGTTTEHSAYKQTKNPWDLSCAPGGSSGGSAASVAARLTPVALGSDTGGSVRQPGALCGVSAFKPTYGRISRYGLVAFGSSLDQIGPFATDVSDIAYLMQILGTHCTKDATSIQKPADDFLSQLDEPISGMRIGVPWDFLETLPEEAKKNFTASIDTLKSLGAIIQKVDLSILKYALPTYYIIATAEASTNLARFDGIRYGKRSTKAETLGEVYDLSREEGFGAEVKRRILLGTFVLSSGYQDAYYKKAQKMRTLIIQKYNEIFTTCALVAMPVTTAAAPRLGQFTTPLEMYLEDIFTTSANLAGLPAISVPSGFATDESKKPLGLQLIGNQLKDPVVCRAAYAFQEATGYNRVIPDAFNKEVAP